MAEQPIMLQNAEAILPLGATERKDVLIQNGRIAKISNNIGITFSSLPQFWNVAHDICFTNNRFRAITNSNNLKFSWQPLFVWFYQFELEFSEIIHNKILEIFPKI